MIHPINISFPDEVMASPRPSFLEIRKRSSQISYLEDGRCLRDGLLSDPKSPNGLWRDFFLRSFVRRIGYDAGNASESSSVDTLIDVVDLEPIKERRNSEASSTASTIERFTFPHTVAEEAYSTPSTSSPFGIEFDDDQPGQFNLSMKSRLCRTNSGVVSENRLQPILEPCCPSSSESKEKPTKKEFLRFDFSHSNIFASDLANKDAPKTLILLPNEYGKRICISKSFDMSFNESLNDFMKSMNTLKQNKPQLHFHIGSVAISNDYLSIFIGITKSKLNATKDLQLETEIHVHSASGKEIGVCLQKQHKTVPIKFNQENNFSVDLEFNQAIKKVFINEHEYLVVTMMGRIV